MAKVRVRALMRGYDGERRREPGEEFDFDVELKGEGKWFELVNEPLRNVVSEDVEIADKPVKKRKYKRSSADDLLA